MISLFASALLVGCVLVAIVGRREIPHLFDEDVRR